MKLYRLLILCLIVMCIVEVCPDSIMANDPDYKGIIYSISDGKIKLTGVKEHEHKDENGNVMFTDCCWLTAIDIPETINGYTVTEISNDTFSKCINLSSITLPDTVTYIGRWAFANCDSLRTINLPKNLQTIGKGAFDGCDNLDNIVIPKSLESVSYDYYIGIRSVFAGCTSLKHITFEEGTKVIPERILSDCPELEEIVIPEGVETIREGAFGGCLKLKEIDIPDTVTAIGRYAYEDCDSLETIVLPKNLRSIGKGAFDGCDNLDNIVIPKTLESVDYDYYTGIHSVFAGCNSLRHITFEEGISFIPDRLLDDCTYLEKIVIPSSVQRISEGAFCGCTVLKEISFPKGVESIEREAFANCEALSKIYFYSLTPSIGKNVFENVNATAYYPYTWTSIPSSTEYGGTITWIPWDPATGKIIDEDGDHKKNSSPIIFEGKDNGTNYKYTFTENHIDKCVAQSKATDGYNAKLSYMLSCMALSAYKYEYIKNAYKNLGFTETCSDNYEGDTDKVAFFAGKKTLNSGKTEVLISIRGTASGSEWISNFTVGIPGFPRLHSGFAGAAIHVYETLQSKGYLNKDTVYFVTGHSRGAAVANLLSVLLNSKAKIPLENIFDYNFACPDVACDKFKDGTTNYFPNIYNINMANDPVTYVPGVLGDSILDYVAYFRDG